VPPPTIGALRRPRQRAKQPPADRHRPRKHVEALAAGDRVGDAPRRAFRPHQERHRIRIACGHRRRDIAGTHGDDGDRFVSASSVTLGGHYEVPTLKPDRDYVQYLLGASADFARVTGYVAASATSGRGEGNAYGVTLGVRVPL
jgi:hypothetical protein